MNNRTTECTIPGIYSRVWNRRRAGNICRTWKFAKKNRHNTGKYL